MKEEDEEGETAGRNGRAVPPPHLKPEVYPLSQMQSAIKQVGARWSHFVWR